MSEKGDLTPHDTESLPPNYATSEVYSDSPPPAYRKTSTVRLQVTRVVCFTILALGFLTGVFILTHTYITSQRQCNCDQVAPNAPVQEASLLGASSLAQISAAPEKEETSENDIQMEELDQESRQMDIPLDEEVIIEEVPQEIENQLAEEEEPEDLQQIVQEVQNNAKLPLDLLMGNPQLAGKDVKCKVEKKIQDLGGGILSKTIMVTCDDENDEAEPIKNPFGGMLTSRPSPAPPMSLLAPILKMMAARASARLQRQLQPKPAFRSLRQPMIQPVGMSIIGGPIVQSRMPGPFPFDGPAPVDGPVRFDGPLPFNGPRFAPHNSRFNSLAREIPLNSYPRRFPIQDNSINESPMPMPFAQPIHDKPAPFFNKPQRLPLPGNFIPFSEERDAPFREDFVENRPPMPEPTPKPFITMIPSKNIGENSHIPTIKANSPIKVIHGLPSQMPEGLKQIVSQIMNRATANNMPGQSIIKIKAISEGEEMVPKSKMLLPLPVRAVKIQGRGARKLSSGEDNIQGPVFPFPRGAMSAGIRPHVVPEAAGRALDSPVALPSLSELPPLRFFPGKLLRIPVPIQGKAITHMEMKQNPNELPIEEKSEIIVGTVEEEPNVPEVVREEGPDFGPPRLHTVIRTPPQSPEESIPLPPFIRHLPAPPSPPQFAREGRVGIIREIDSDAELVKPVVAEAKTHRMIMVN